MKAFHSLLFFLLQRVTVTLWSEGFVCIYVLACEPYSEQNKQTSCLVKTVLWHEEESQLVCFGLCFYRTFFLSLWLLTSLALWSLPGFDSGLLHGFEHCACFFTKLCPALQEWNYKMENFNMLVIQIVVSSSLQEKKSLCCKLSTTRPIMIIKY